MEKKKSILFAGGAAVLMVALVVMVFLFVQAKQTAGIYQAQGEEMTAQIADLTADAANKDSQIEALTADAADKDSKIEALTADAADKDSKIEALTADAADKDRKIESLAADIAGQIESLAADVTAKDSQIDSLKAALEQALDAAPARVEIPDTIPGAYNTTREFLYLLEQWDVAYDYQGVDSDGDDNVTMNYVCDGQSFTFHLWFSSDGNQANLRVWDIISFNSQFTSAVRAVCDELNSSYRFTTFYLEYDNTVTLSMDFIIRDNGSAGEIVLEGLVSAYLILEDAYASLAPYNS